MADFTTAAGRGVTFDLDRITQREYGAFAHGTLMEADDYALLAKVSGLTVAEILDLPRPEYRRLVKAFFKRATEPLADPN